MSKRLQKQSHFQLCRWGNVEFTVHPQHQGGNPNNQGENITKKMGRSRNQNATVPTIVPLLHLPTYKMLMLHDEWNTWADADSAHHICTWIMRWGRAKQHSPLSLFDVHGLPHLRWEKIKVWERWREKTIDSRATHNLLSNIWTSPIANFHKIYTKV